MIKRVCSNVAIETDLIVAIEAVDAKQTKIYLDDKVGTVIKINETFEFVMGKLNG